jgi:hypothetical protein
MTPDAECSTDRSAIHEVAYLLGRIENMTVNLRNGGPHPTDLQRLSDCLAEACDLAAQAGNLLADFHRDGSCAALREVV